MSSTTRKFLTGRAAEYRSPKRRSLTPKERAFVDSQEDPHAKEFFEDLVTATPAAIRDEAAHSIRAHKERLAEAARPWN